MKTTALPILRKPALLLGAAAGALLLASCGGNNTNNPTPTPTATGTATPTPTPTSTEPPADVNFANDFAYSSGRLYIYAFFTPTGGVQVFSDASRLANATGGVSFTFSPENVLFGFTDLDDPVEFDATTLVSGSSTLRTYEKGDEKLKLELPFGNVLRATYTRSDSDIVGVDPGTLLSDRVLVIIDGVTTEDDITTDLDYTGTPHVVGGEPGVSLPGAFTAPARNFSVDATSDTLTGTIQIFEDVGGTPTLIAELEVDTTVGASEAFATDLTDATGGFTGSMAGTLAGANREEIVFIFSVSHTDGRKFVGSYIGNQIVVP